MKGILKVEATHAFQGPSLLTFPIRLLTRPVVFISQAARIGRLKMRQVREYTCQTGIMIPILCHVWMRSRTGLVPSPISRRQLQRHS